MMFTFFTSVLLSFILLFPQLQPAHAQTKFSTAKVHARSLLDSLLRDEDTDNDLRITIVDRHIAGTHRGDKRFDFSVHDGRRYEVGGTYYLSNLLQELKLGEEGGRDSVTLDGGTIFEPPVQRISRLIREVYWDGLARCMDEAGLRRILEDEKTKSVDGRKYVYVPFRDSNAFRYYEEISLAHPGWNMHVVRLPAKITGTYVRTLDGRHGILSLGVVRDDEGKLTARPFVVPGGRFNEMYGWDSYFITLGLLVDGRFDLAKSMVDNAVYEVNHYGAILNANRTYYLTRSQPPFLTSMIRAVHGKMSASNETKDWLRNALAAAISEYTNVWMGSDRLTKIGLSRYYDTGIGPPPEVEPGHFDPVFARFAVAASIDARKFEADYRSGRLKTAGLDEYFVHDRAMRESGHDTSYRLEGRCANLTTVDLNSLLYKIEMDIYELIVQEFDGIMALPDGSVHRSSEWKSRAEQRKTLIDKWLWDAGRGVYFDYDVVKNGQTGYRSATTFYPLWAGLASTRQAATVVERALPLLTAQGGIVGSTEESRGAITPAHPLRQWDFPFGWAPHQMLVWQGLRNYGYDSLARDLAYRWLFTIVSNAANYNGTVPEKFDLVERTHQVFAEYGNVGTTFSYITREGFGWTNASFQIGRGLLTEEQLNHLNNLVPPEWLSK